MAVKTNEDRLIAVSVMGQIAAPQFPPVPAMPYMLDAEGHPFLLPAWGGIVYNVSVGDSAYGWLGDSIHPGVSISLKDDNGNRGLNILACVGNEAVVMSGLAQGAKGVVTGKSGRFSEQVILHFDPADRDNMAIGDKIVVKAKGIGLEFADHPAVKTKGVDPRVLDALEVTSRPDGRLAVPVVGVVPPHLLGAGAGLTSDGGSIHIQTKDRAALEEANLHNLRLGDVVALDQYDSSYNHGYLRGAVGIGVIGQTDSPRPGYGPGITMLLTSASGGIAPTISAGVNLKDVLSL